MRAQPRPGGRGSQAKPAWLGWLVRGRLPVLSLGVIVVSAVLLLAMARWPGVLPALQRDRDALSSGEFWRVLSPLLVDTDGWFQWIIVSLGFATVGVAVEQRQPRARWLGLFLAGAIAGEVAGYAWHPSGGGTSIALCGLIGGLASGQARGAGQFALLGTLYGTSVAGALAAAAVLTRLGGGDTVKAIGVMVAGGVIVNLLLQAHGRKGDRVAASTAAIVVGAAALLLLALHDIHGPALLAGLVVGWLMVTRRSRGAARPI